MFLAQTPRGILTKILDFGLAEVFSEANTWKPSRAGDSSGVQAFTLQYGAPEQFDRIIGATGPWRDVHALALLLIEAVAAVTP